MVTYKRRRTRRTRRHRKRTRGGQPPGGNQPRPRTNAGTRPQGNEPRPSRPALTISIPPFVNVTPAVPHSTPVNR